MDKIVSEDHEIQLKRYLELPSRLEAAIAGLTEQQLDLTLGKGWSIRAYVHHTVEGEQMWQMALRSILGRNGAEFPMQWYFAMPQDEWAQRWAYDRRPIGPALALYRASTSGLVEMLRSLPAQVWDCYGRVTWPGQSEETCITVEEILLTHLRHLDQHAADIQAIRTMHNC